MATMEEMFFNNMRLHEHDLRDKTQWWKGQNKRWRQHLVQSVDKVPVLTAPASIVGHVIGPNIISTIHVLQKRSKKASALADGPRSATVSINGEYFHLVERAHKRLHRASSGGATKLYVRLIPTTLRNAKFARRNKSVATFSSETGLFNDARRDLFPFKCTTRA